MMTDQQCEEVPLTDGERQELDRFREAIARIEEKRRLQSDTWRVHNRKMDYGQGWHDGYTTALASVSLIISEVTDPEGWAEHEASWRAASCASEREWFERTGNCGHCGNPAEDCVCTDDDPCECGPHPNRRTWPRDCGWCKGTGKVEPLPYPITQRDSGPPRDGDREPANSDLSGGTAR